MKFLYHVILHINLYLIEDYQCRVKKDPSLIYILIWLPNPRISPSWNYEIWQLYFYNKNCRYKNCFLTHDYDYFDDVRNFDVIIYNIWTLSNYLKPSLRSENQTYILFSEEPPSFCPMPLNQTAYDRFFNLTWTYKLESDISLKFFLIRDSRGEVTGPKVNMTWLAIEDMKPVSEYVKSKLKNKNKAAAWFVSHCETPGKREDFVKILNDELYAYNLKVDIFGDCGNFVCPVDNEECHALIESDYYFYLAFENSLCEDYVTEKVLTATKHFAVPIIYGGADYSRFLPPGSYLDAYALVPKELAKSMYAIITDKELYYEFFRWHDYYSFHAPDESPETDNVCGFCTYLNEEKRIEHSVYENMSVFWSCNEKH